jgi:hypothetical protein
MNTTGEVISLESSGGTKLEDMNPSQLHRHWDEEITASEKRLRQFIKQGNQVVKRYLDERRDSDNYQRSADTPSKLNLFHTNVSTLESMLYGSTPKIEVAREHHDPDDDVARVAALIYQRILESDVAAPGSDLATCLRAALQDRLLPGLGTARIKYDCTIEKETSVDPYTGEEVEVERLVDEYCKPQYVHWQDYRWGWGRTWTEVPWTAYRAWMCKNEVTERFGEKVAKNLEYKNQTPTGSSKDDTLGKDQQNNRQKAEIWEIWCKTSKKVYWFSPGASLILDVQDDPLGLRGFFPGPPPMMANLTTTLFVPRADFVIAQDLYNEIDVLQTRISVITRAIKVVGVYDKGAGDSVGRMLKEGTENDLIPVDNWAMFAEKGGLRGTMEWFPVQDVVGVLQTLGQVQQEKISQLYEITGLSDIMRGANTDQYTAANTQAMKAKMGSIRVQSLQDQFAQFASQLDEIKAEVISKHYSTSTIFKQSNAQFLPQADQQLVGPAVQLMQSPDIKWRVTIRPESIAMVDYAQLKAERVEFLTAMATYIQSAQAAASSMGPQAIPVLLELLKWGMSGFKGSNYLEGTMDRAIQLAQQAASQPQEDPAAQEAQRAQQEAQMQFQMDMQKIQAKAQADLQIQQTKMQGEMQRAQIDHQTKMEQQVAKNQGEQAKIMSDLRADLQVIAAKLDADLAVEEAQSTYAAAEEELEHQNTMAEKQTEHQYALQERETTSMDAQE